MAGRHFTTFFKPVLISTNVKLHQVPERLLHISPALFTVQAGKVKISLRKDKPVSYENSFSPRHIAHRKSWNSWNTSTIEGGLKPAETLFDDVFIRKFMTGTFPSFLMSKVIIKRQHNIVRVAAIIKPNAPEQTLCFLIGYTEAMLSYWLQCIVKLELQVVNDPRKMVFKYV